MLRWRLYGEGFKVKSREGRYVWTWWVAGCSCCVGNGCFSGVSVALETLAGWLVCTE